MICAACAQAADQRRSPHDRCPGETWCDCQHFPVRRDPGDTGKSGGVVAGTVDADTGPARDHIHP